MSRVIDAHVHLGSDWPVALLNGGYARVWACTREAVAASAGEHVAALMGENACRIYRLPSQIPTARS